jgi:hypothetical protein
MQLFVDCFNVWQRPEKYTNAIKASKEQTTYAALTALCRCSDQRRSPIDHFWCALKNLQVVSRTNWHGGWSTRVKFLPSQVDEGMHCC